MALALSIYVLFISPMRSVNGAQFLYTTSLALVSGFAAGGGAGTIDKDSLASVYASL